MSGHIVTDFKDLRKIIGEITTTQPAKSRYQQQAEKMNSKEASVPFIKQKGSKSRFAANVKIAGKKEIQKAYMKIGKSAQGPDKKQMAMVAKELEKMGYKTYDPIAMKKMFEELARKALLQLQEISLDNNMLRKDFPNVWATKDSKLFRVLNVFINTHGWSDNAKSYKKDKKKFVDDLKKVADSPAAQKRAMMGYKDMNYINSPKKGQSFWSATFQTPEQVAAATSEVAGFKAPFGKITQADKDDAIDFLQSIKKNDPNAYKRLIKRLKLKEGTMTVPDTKKKQQALKKVLQRPLKAKDAQQAIQNYVDDDGLADKIGAMPGNKDAREVIIKWLNTYGPNKTKSWGSMINAEVSRSQQVKEASEHAKQSPFKLKSQQYPRAVAINTDGFGNRHATVEDIITACETFGMILDKELQVEQIQKQLGKKGFITYNNSELEDVFEERETERMILALESVTEEQEPIEYCQGEIAYAQLHEHEIEFLKPNGQKAKGPVLKMGGNTYNVKDKHTGKSFTYKYIGETEVKTFREVVNEGFSSSLIKKAISIANSKEFKQGNYTGAVKAIDKLKKGLSDDPKVAAALKKANESKAPKVSKGKKFTSIDKLYTVLLKTYEDIEEGKMKDIMIDFEQGDDDKTIAKANKMSVSVIKGLRKDWKQWNSVQKEEEKMKSWTKPGQDTFNEYVKAGGQHRKVKEGDKRRKENRKLESNKLNNWIPEGDKEAYQKFFNNAMKKFGVSSPDELKGDKKKEFFDYVDKNWKADHEEVDIHKSYKMDGRRKNFKEKMKKLGYIKGW